MSHQIIPQLTAAEHFASSCKFWNSYEDWFLQRDQVRLHLYNGSLHITDITDAMKPGKVCEEFTFNWNIRAGGGKPHGLYTLFKRHGYNMRSLVNEMRRLNWKPATHWKTGEVIGGWKNFDFPGLIVALPEFGQLSGDPTENATLFRSERKSIRIWSPFNLVHPLPERPAKWTVSHVIRALLSGQFDDLKCDGVYTDDYAWDAAVDFQRGKFAEPSAAIAFARRIVENPSGWWAYERDGSVSICCHHFDSNSFKFNLMKRFNAAAAAAAATQTEPSATVVYPEAIHAMPQDEVRPETGIEDIDADVGERPGRGSAKLIETAHTKTKATIFVVQLAERLSRKEYERVLDIAKSFGGYYSSYRRDGAVPGFIFKEKSPANNFIAKLSPEPTNLETTGAPEGAQAEPASEISAAVPPPSPVVTPQIAPMPGFTPLGIPAWRLRFRQ